MDKIASKGNVPSYEEVLDFKKKLEYQAEYGVRYTSIPFFIIYKYGLSYVKTCNYEKAIARHPREVSEFLNLVIPKEYRIVQVTTHDETSHILLELIKKPEQDSFGNQDLYHG